MHFYKSILALVALAFITGCTLGPSALVVTSSQYNRALQRSEDEQLLLNLVRLKYRDSPVFLELGSISAQFNFGSSISAAGTINEGARNEVFGFGGNLSFQDRPTLTYTPLRGEDFVERLMSPLEIDTLMLLYYSGWSIDRIFRLTLQSINGVENAMSAAGPTPAAAPEYADFARVTEILRDLQVQGLLKVGYESTTVTKSPPIPAGQVTGADLIAAAADGLTFRSHDSSGLLLELTESSQRPLITVDPSALGMSIVTELYDLLNLKPKTLRFALGKGVGVGSSGSVERQEEVSLVVRSLVGTFFYLSQGVAVPPEHRARGLVTETLTDGGDPFDWSKVTKDLLRVQVRKFRPVGAAVAIPYRGHWFFIADDDLYSKSTFMLLGQLLSLQSGDQKGTAPVLTLPVGG